MATGLTALTRLETLHIGFAPPEQSRRRSDPPMRVALSVLTNFEFEGRTKYLEDFVAQIDAPRLIRVCTGLSWVDFITVPQLSLFVGRAENLRFR